MPYARIEISSGWSLCPREHLLQAVDDALVASLGVPPHDAFLRLFDYRFGDALTPARHGPHFVFVEIQLFPGRTIETKRKLYRTVAERLQSLGIPGNDITIALIEISQENWGVQGGQLVSEIDHGFVVER